MKKVLWNVIPTLPYAILPIIFGISYFIKHEWFMGSFCVSIVALTLVLGYYANKAFR